VIAPSPRDGCVPDVTTCKRNAASAAKTHNPIVVLLYPQPDAPATLLYNLLPNFSCPEQLLHF
jgi:hypothetical protein